MIENPRTCGLPLQADLSIYYCFILLQERLSIDPLLVARGRIVEPAGAFLGCISIIFDLDFSVGGLNAGVMPLLSVWKTGQVVGETCDKAGGHTTHTEAGHTGFSPIFFCSSLPLLLPKTFPPLLHKPPPPSLVHICKDNLLCNIRLHTTLYSLFWIRSGMHLLPIVFSRATALQVVPPWC